MDLNEVVREVAERNRSRVVLDFRAECIRQASVRKQLETDGFDLHGNRFVKGKEVFLPLYEAKMIHQFDHRFGSFEAVEERVNTSLPTPTEADYARLTVWRCLGIGSRKASIVARKIANHQFAIQTSAANVEVSWQVTGVRQDAYAKAYPLVVEEAKEGQVRGFYIHPELYGAPEEKQIEWARHPEMMKRKQERRTVQAAGAADAQKQTTLAVK
jgi:hypothetical protein